MVLLSDLINDIHLAYFEHPGFVKEINENGVRIVWQNTEYHRKEDRIAQNCDLDPIVITEDFLKSSGWESDYSSPDNHQFTDPSEQIRLIHDPKNPNTKWKVTIENKDTNFISHLELNYVHELEIFANLTKVKIKFPLYALNETVHSQYINKKYI